MDGIEDITTKVEEHVVLIHFDDAETSTEAMQKALDKALFPVEKVEVLQEELTGM